MLYDLTPDLSAARAADGAPDLREYLLTNGTGSFAMGTVSGIATRRYHSLLNAALHPPVGRINLVPRVGEIVLLDGAPDFHELSANQFTGGSIHPRGFQLLRSFTLGAAQVGTDAHPGLHSTATWEYAVDGVTVTKQLVLPPDDCAAEITYTVKGKPKRPIELRLLPMVALRDFHALRRAAGWNMGVHPQDNHLIVEADGLAVRLSAAGTEFHSAPDWWRNFHYAIETERGQDDTEDLFVPGYFSAALYGSGSVTLRISPDPIPAPSGKPFLLPPLSKNRTLARLEHAAADFVVRRKTPARNGAAPEIGTTVLAGYPWFADWGRDTFISLPGLLLTTGRLAEAEQVLTLFAQYVDAGMIPNKFDDYSNEPSYNTVDASLWFVHAAHEFLNAGGNRKSFEQKLLPACHAIIAGYRDGTRYHIKMDPADGLIYQGDASTQLTWMDAKYQGVAFTPRQGKAVEINALWYNALRLLGEGDIADKVQRSFTEQFWIDETTEHGGGLYDVVDGDHKDAAIRPNQIFAVSLPHSPLTLDQQKAVVKIVRHHLLTPHGLRTLAPSDPNYHPVYTGPQSQRDAAYHNGTVWAWLIGPFLDAYLRAHGDTAKSKSEAKKILAPLIEHMDQNCLGQIAEIFDGDPPHAPKGTPAQAWSIAEVLRLAAKLG
jgi:glycogen debranching enzyme